jgi:hypothetical protein
LFSFRWGFWGDFIIILISNTAKFEIKIDIFILFLVRENNEKKEEMGFKDFYFYFYVCIHIYSYIN